MPHPTGSNPLQALQHFGQAPWVDFIRRGFLADGSLARLIAQDGVAGVTSNPAIFERAIAGSTEYDSAIAAALQDGLADAGALYESLAVADIAQAADILAPVHAASGGADGFVSLEVSPYLAFDAAGTIAEARALWARVARPNLMIKVPGTAAGAEAIRVLIEDGININVTLLFAQSAYQAVAEAFLAGLEARRARGLGVAGIHSVASFFISRIDSVVDGRIDARLAAGDALEERLRALRGKVAIANAKLAYRWFEALSASARWQSLAADGAAPQRLLWASTGTKDKAYSDVRYVEELIGPLTVNTMPPATMDAFRDHGVAAARLTENVAEAEAILAEAAALGFDLDEITARLVVDGARLFTDAFDQLLGAVAAKRTQLLGERQLGLRIALPAHIAAARDGLAESWRAGGLIRRLWALDASVWTGGPEARWLGWLGVAAERRAGLGALLAFQTEIKAAQFSDVLLLGMGGSSLGPEVLARVFGQQSGFPKLHVLDSTDPDQIARFEAGLDLARTLVIVSSKSGGTLEPNILLAHFWARMEQALGRAPGDHFVTVTDPGSAMQARAEALGFRRIFFGDPQIGGRFSVLSNFGLVPAAAAGMDLAAFLDGALRMVAACGALVPPAQNPGVQLGLALAACAQAGRDKLTIRASASLASVSAWLEQLIAESTGKHGQGIIPIEGEPTLDIYGADRVFVRLVGPDAGLAEIVPAIAAAHPVIEIVQAQLSDLGQQFFLWEMATAVAGAVLGIDPFDQPDVESAKVEARALTSAYAETGKLPERAPIAAFGEIEVFAPAGRVATGPSLAAMLGAFLGQAVAGDYFVILAYLDQNAQNIAALDAIRGHVARHYGIASAVQFGPRFLHSTGQLYKGGPKRGIFLQITAAPTHDLPVPGETFSFGIVERAQALGDLAVLEARGQRTLHVHMQGDISANLAILSAAATGRAAG